MTWLKEEHYELGQSSYWFWWAIDVCISSWSFSRSLMLQTCVVYIKLRMGLLIGSIAVDFVTGWVWWNAQQGFQGPDIWCLSLSSSWSTGEHYQPRFSCAA
jgi:hypothetical protein